MPLQPDPSDLIARWAASGAAEAANDAPFLTELRAVGSAAAGADSPAR